MQSRSYFPMSSPYAALLDGFSSSFDIVEAIYYTCVLIACNASSGVTISSRFSLLHHLVALSQCVCISILLSYIIIYIICSCLRRYHNWGHWACPGTSCTLSAVTPIIVVYSCEQFAFIPAPEVEYNERPPGWAAYPFFYSLYIRWWIWFVVGTFVVSSLLTWNLGGDALNADGTLKDASEITWYNDKDDTTPIASGSNPPRKFPFHIHIISLFLFPFQVPLLVDEHATLLAWPKL